MDKLKELYVRLKRQGIIPKNLSFAEFQNQYTGDKAQTLYTSVAKYREDNNKGPKYLGFDWDNKGFDEFNTEYSLGFSPEEGGAESLPAQPFETEGLTTDVIEETKEEITDAANEPGAYLTIEEPTSYLDIKSVDDRITEINQKYIADKNKIEEENPKNKNSLLKDLKERTDATLKELEIIRNKKVSEQGGIPYGYDKNWAENVKNEGLTEKPTDNPKVKYTVNMLSDYQKHLKSIGFYPGKGEQEEVIVEGIHDWMQSGKPSGSAALAAGMGDYDVQSIYDLFTGKGENKFLTDESRDSDTDRNLLVPILQNQYPGYKFEVMEPGKGVPSILNNSSTPNKVDDAYNTTSASAGMKYNPGDNFNAKEHGIKFESILVTAPNGETMILGSEVQPNRDAQHNQITEDYREGINSFIDNETAKLKNFINTTAGFGPLVDIGDGVMGIEYSKWNKLTQKPQIIEKIDRLSAQPWDDPDNPGIGLNRQQADDASVIGDYQINDEFKANPNITLTVNQLLIDGINKENSGLAGYTLAYPIPDYVYENPNSKESNEFLKQWVTNFANTGKFQNQSGPPGEVPEITTYSFEELKKIKNSRSEKKFGLLPGSIRLNGAESGAHYLQGGGSQFIKGVVKLSDLPSEPSSFAIYQLDEEAKKARQYNDKRGGGRVGDKYEMVNVNIDFTGEMNPVLMSRYDNMPLGRLFQLIENGEGNSTSPYAENLLLKAHDQMVNPSKYTIDFGPGTPTEALQKQRELAIEQNSWMAKEEKAKFIQENMIVKGSPEWEIAESSLMPFYPEGVPEQVVYNKIAQQKYQDFVQPIINDNMNNYLWNVADNDNIDQTLMKWFNITLRDKKLTESMALMALNEADLTTYSNPQTAVNIALDNFEDVYNDPTKNFEVDLTLPFTTLPNGKVINNEQYNNYVSSYNTKSEQLRVMLQRRSEAWELQDEVGNLDANLNLLGKDYDTWASSYDALGLAVKDIGVGLLYGLGKAIKYASPAASTYYAGMAAEWMDDDSNPLSSMWDDYDEWMADAYDDYVKHKAEVNSRYGEAVKFHANKYGQGGAFSSANDFGRFVAMETGKQIPILATIIASGGTAAPWVIGAYSAGQHWADGDLKEYHSGVAENEFIQAVSSIGYGAAEGVFEALTTVPILARGKSLLTRSGKQSLLDYKNGMKQYFKDNTLHVATAPVAEAVAEGLTGMSQNLIDGRPIMENVDHAMFVGGMFGFAMSASPFLAGAAARQFTDYNAFAEFKKQDQQIYQLQLSLNTQKANNTISPDAANVVQDQINNLKKKQYDYVAKKFGAINNTMDEGALDNFIDNVRAQANISEAANEMLNEGVNNDYIAPLKQQFDLLQASNDVYRSNAEFSNKFTMLETTDKKRYDRLVQEAKDKLAANNNGKVRDDQVLPEAQRLYKGELIDENFKQVSSARKQKNKKYLKFDTNGEALTYIDDVLETSKEIIQNDNTLTEEQQKAEIDNLEREVRGFKDGVNSSAMDKLAGGSLSGWNMMFDKRGVLTTDGDAVVRNEVLGFRENAIKNNETEIFTHEASHATFGDLLGFDSAAFDPLAEEVIKYLQAEHADIWEAMVQRRGTELLKSDEVVMNFLEIAGRKNSPIDLNNNKGKRLGASFGFNLNQIFKRNKNSTIDYKGANDTIVYLTNLAKAVSEGRINKSFQGGKKNKVIKEARDRYRKAKRAEEKAIQEFKEKTMTAVAEDIIGKQKFSDSKDMEESAEILQKLNKLVADNKVKPVKGYAKKVAALTARFKELKARSGVVKEVPTFKKGETDAQRKERVNLTERSFRGRLETAQGGKPMQEIIKGYEEKMLSLARKSGFFSTDSYSSFESQAAKEAEFLSFANTELMKAIRTFNPSKNTDFDAWVMSPKILPNKVKGANKLLAREYKSQGFTTDLGAASGVAVGQDTALQEFEKTLREELKITKDSPFYGAVMEAVQETMAKGLPKFEYTQTKKKGKGKTVTLAEVRKTLATNPTGETRLQAERDLAGIYKNVKSQLEANYQKALDSAIKKEFLKAGKYDAFLKKAQPHLMKMLDISNLVALERLVPDSKKILTKVVKKNLNVQEVKKYEGGGNVKTATTTQGPTLYARLNPTEKQFVDFFNVRGRKNALAKILAGHFGLDATMQNLTSEKVVNELSQGNPQIKEQLGQETVKDFAAAIKRGTAFKFSLAETVGMEGKLAEDYKELQPALLDQIINMEVSDPMSVKLAVDVVYSDKKFAPYRTKIKSVFEKLLKPYRKAIKQEGKTEFNLNEYITSVESALDAENSISKMWGQKPMAEALRDPDDIANFKEFDNRLAQQRLLDLAGKDKDGNQNPVTEQMKIEQATQDLRWQHGRQKGTKPGTVKARGMVYASPAQLFNEFFLPNYGFKGRKLNGKGEKRTLQFIKEDGTFTDPIPFPASPKQVVTEGMVPGGTMSQSELDFREEIADQAFNYVVNSYKAAKTLLDNGGGTKLDMAMLMNMYGQFMEGPIRAAAPFRYRALDAPTTKLRDKDGNKNFEYEHGIPAKIFNLLVADAIFFNNKEIDLQKLKDSYAVGAIPVNMNDNFSTFFADRMQFGYKVGDIAPMRWYNMFTRGKASYAVEDVRTGERYGEKQAKLWKSIQAASNQNKFSLSNDVVGMEELNLDADEVLDYAATIDEALRIARDPNAPVKKIRVFDFDDTLATSKNVVFYTMPDGTKGRLNAEEFAKEGGNLIDQGAKMDFTDFNTVREGGKGPLADLAKTIIDKRGSEDVFILTARASDAQINIHDFLQSIGINIPLKNITGLGNSSPFAKSKWIIEKAAEGYNDFYFADDAIQNVNAVRDALDVIDVKSKVQQAKFKFSETVDKEFNQILEHSQGIEWYKEFSAAKGRILGAKKRKLRIHPFSAEDFEGLMYPLLGKGKKGEAAYDFFDKHLFKPFARAMSDIATAQVNMMDDFKQLKKDLNIPKKLRATNDSGFTNENAVRIAIWSEAGYDIPGISKTDLKEINDLVNADEELKLFKEELIKVNKGEYAQPGTDWLAGTITTDLITGLNKIKRKDYLKQWKDNVDIIFSEKNMNKLEAALGPKYVEALKNSLQRMESGSNRLYSNSRLANKALDYLNNAQGVVMFLNMRSALLQGISNINFINWSFNNPIKAGAALANMPQYAKDFVELMNSDYLKARRGGLAMDINENEVANSAATSANKAKAIVSYIIEKGYTPTKFMDSFAIASGGATFYRNRINDLIKREGMSEAEAKAKAYQEFVEISEKSQQSSRPDKISSQQASTLGRIMLNWANTQMQYVRIQKKAIQDLANGRGDAKEHISKIAYYGLVQNMLFMMAHSAVFALGFGDGDDEDFRDAKIERVANGALDNILRGLGIGGHIISVLKNYGIKVNKELSKTEGRIDVSNQTWELIKLSPVVSSKIQRLRSAAWEFDSKKRRQAMIDMGFDIDNPAYDAAAKVISAVTNVPLDRLLLKMDNVRGALDSENETWMRIAMILGWPKWNLEPKESVSTKTTKAPKTWGKPKEGYKPQKKTGSKKPAKYW